jgi:tRNA(Ile)-lysidine synthase
MVTDKVRKTITQNNLIEKGEHIVIGVSGGPDSVCLLSVFQELAEEWELTLHAVHVNHQLRGEKADEDQRYTEELCRRFGIPCHVFYYDVKALAAEQKVSVEEAGRMARYEAFDKVKKEIESKIKRERESSNGALKAPKVKIATAHNSNDQAETLLMRIIRGTGTDGLAGMEYIHDGLIIRPLLDVSRDEIEEYCEERNLNPRIDLTNLEPAYTRNRIRLELLPLLQSQYNGNILSALNRLAGIAWADKEYLYLQVERAKEILTHEGESCKIDREGYKKLHPAIGKRLINASLKEMGLLQDMTAVHLDSADYLLRQGRTGDRIAFPDGYGLRLTYGKGELYRQIEKIGDRFQSNAEDENKGNTAFCYPVSLNNTVQIPELNALLKVRILQEKPDPKLYRNNRFCACLDLAGKGIKDGIFIRTRRSGDYIIPLGMRGRKKLQDYFVDEKIPWEERDRIPLLCFGREVLWVVGHRLNENYKVTESATEIVCVEYVPLV